MVKAYLYIIQINTFVPVMNTNSIIIESKIGGFKKAIINLLKLYIKHVPTTAGKGLITRYFINPLLPDAPNTFLALTPNNAKMHIQYKSMLGRAIYLKDAFFESAEIKELCRYIKPGVAMDIGANIGIYTISMAKEMGAKGEIWSFEPLPPNVKQVEDNLLLNNLNNARIYPIALGNENGTIALKLSDDDMFASTVEVFSYESGKTLDVAIKKLDTVWQEKNKPAVSVIKIDVEGAEMDVLAGAVEVLKANKPVLLLEAATSDHFNQLSQWLSPFGYKAIQPKGFEKWNYLFVTEN
jgi:FkbM family methyltransferase